MNALADPQLCFRWIAILLGCGITLSSLRDMAIRHEFQPTGMYPWLLRGECLSGFWQFAMVHLLEHPGFTLLLVVRAGSAIGIVGSAIGGAVSGLAVTLLLISSLIKVYRLPLMSDESEVMNLTILVPLAFHVWAPENAFVARVGLWFIGLQVCLAYLATGISKLMSANWRRGVTLANIFDGSLLRHPWMAGLLTNHRRLGWCLCWFTIVLEVIFPLALFAPAPIMTALLIGGFLFHLNVALLMGLSSFFWAFVATYPAIVYINLNPLVAGCFG